MASEAVLQLPDTSVDSAGLSTVSATRNVMEPRHGTMYNPMVLAAGVPVWFHPLNDGRYIGLLRSHWFNATVGPMGPQSYSGHAEGGSVWVRTAPPHGETQVLGKIRDGLTLGGAASQGDFLFTVGVLSGTPVLVPSPDFEDTTVLREYGGAGYTNSYYTTEQTHSGLHSWKITATGDYDTLWLSPYVGAPGSFPNRDHSPEAAIKVKEGERYYLECWVYPEAGNVRAGGCFSGGHLVNSATGDTTYPGFYMDGDPPNGMWTKCAGYYTIPAGYDQLHPFYCTTPAITPGNVYYVDDVVLARVDQIDLQLGALVQHHRIGPGGSLMTVGEDLLPVTNGVLFDKGCYVDGQFLVVLGTDADDKVYLARRQLSRIGTTVSPWEYRSAKGWLADTTNLEPIGLTSVGPVSATTFRDRLLVSTVARTDDSYAAAVYQARATDLFGKWKSAGPAVPLDVAVPPNLVISPDFEDTSIQRYYVGDYSTEQARSGTRSWKMTKDPAAGVAWLALMSASASGLPWGDNAQWMKVQPGERFYMEAWVYGHPSNTGEVDCQLYANLRDSRGITADAYPAAEWLSNVPVGAWTKLSGEVTVPAGLDLALFGAQLGVGPTGSTVYWDDVVVRKVILGTYLGGTLYFQPQLNASQPLPEGAVAQVPYVLSVQGTEAGDNNSIFTSWGLWPISPTV